MSTTICVYGASDDLVEIDGDIEGADEYGVGMSGQWRGMLVAPGGETALLYVDYRKGGTWTVTLGQWEEDYPLPAWPAHYTVDPEICAYSTLLTLEVPEGTILTEAN